jgi:hypothetical protein
MTGLPSLDGRRFGSVSNTSDGEVDADTVFHYRQDGEVVSASYAGGQVRRGELIGTREGDTLEFRYVHLNLDGRTASGHCVSRVEVLDDGRLRLHETWEWESMPGAGTSVVEELP